MAEIRGEKAKGLYFSETLQLRALINNRIAKLGLLASYIGTCVIYSILLWGRPEDDYWSGDAAALGGVVNLTVCERPDTNEFVRLPLNAIATLAPIFVGNFIFTMFFLDRRDRAAYDSSLGNKPASIVLRFPIWSFFFAITYLFLGIAGLLFFASTMSFFSTVFTVAQWSSILALCLCSVNRLLDPPVKKPSSAKKCLGYFFAAIFMTSHVVLTVLLIISLDERAAESAFGDDEDLRTLSSDIPSAAMYGLVVLAVICAVVHWRTHTLSIKQQPVLLFGAGVISIVAAGFDSYDVPGGVACFPNSKFQLGAFGFFLLNLAGLLAYLFLRADNWEEEEKIKTVRERSTHRLVVPEDDPTPNVPTPASTTPTPEHLGDPTQTDAHRRTTAGNFIGGIDQVIRRATTEIAQSRYVTPEIGFTSTQIRLAEILIGMVIVAFIILVVYFTFSANL